MPFIIVLVLTSFSSRLVNAELSLASPFTDNAILQQAMPIPVWGKADPKTVISVKFAGQEKSSKADADGRWKVTLDPLKASFDSRKLTVTSSADEKLVIKNVLVGEVWICSGQSNMQFGHRQLKGFTDKMPRIKNIRVFTVQQMVSMTEQERCEGQWEERYPDSAVALSFGYFLEKAAEVPVGIVQTCWGSSSIEGWMPRDISAELPHFRKQMEAFDADEEKLARINGLLNKGKPWVRKDDIFLRTQPNILYNAMMKPLIPMACRGIAWYQGEANEKGFEQMAQYGKTLPAWVKRYRAGWGRDDLHFLVVMLPGYAKGIKDQATRPDVRSRAWIRESQLKVLDLPHTSVANTIDLGHLTNNHPIDKLPVGKRLALLAARDVLKKQVEASGPVLQKTESKDDRIIVRFDHATGLKTRDGKAPTGFWLTDDSEKWFEAKAEIDGETVVLTSSDLPKPRFVRYAFAGKPQVNLVNVAGLPAYPFRTDNETPEQSQSETQRKTGQPDASQLNCFGFSGDDHSGLQNWLRFKPKRTFLLSAHRGGAQPGFPENCIATFEHSLAHGSTMLEIDPRLTRDGTIVLHHDKTLDRTTSGTGRLSDRTLAELQKLTLTDLNGEPTTHRMPTLQQTIDWARNKTVLVVDQKDVPLEQRIAAISDNKAEGFVMLIIGNLKQAKQVHQSNSKIKMEIMVPDLKRVKAIDESGIPWSNLVAFIGHQPPYDRELIKAIHARGAMCMAGTSRNLDLKLLKPATSKPTQSSETIAEEYQDLLDLGIDILETDLPNQVREVLRSK